MTTYRVRYYKRNPIDPQSRWMIYRENVTAETADEAKRIIQDGDCEVIDVEDDTAHQEYVAKRQAETREAVQQIKDGAYVLQPITSKYRATPLPADDVYWLWTDDE